MDKTEKARDRIDERVKKGEISDVKGEIMKTIHMEFMCIAQSGIFLNGKGDIQGASVLMSDALRCKNKMYSMLTYSIGSMTKKDIDYFVKRAERIYELGLKNTRMYLS